MGEIKIKDKEVTVPGEVLAVGMDYLPAGGAFRDKEEIIASQVGIVNISGRLIKLVSLNTRYMPKKGDRIIGKVADIGPNAWYVDFGFYNQGAIALADGSLEYIPRGADLSQYYAVGDYVVAIVVFVTRDNHVNLSLKGPGLRKLSEGRIIKINPAKVPRVIGKEASMITMVKNMTECRVIVGQNGWVWISGLDLVKESIAIEAINLIDTRAHIQGLTDEVKNFLEKKLGGKSGVQQEN
ncbi:MAG: exosome complex RNA-binding protein Rrp4 [Nanoarchaeota archaeon]